MILKENLFFIIMIKQLQSQILIYLCNYLIQKKKKKQKSYYKKIIS
jgi:hypothetical protein